VDTATLVFGADDFATAQTVTITGVDDAVADGPTAYEIIFDPASSDDPSPTGTAPR